VEKEPDFKVTSKLSSSQKAKDKDTYQKKSKEHTSTNKKVQNNNQKRPTNKGDSTEVSHNKTKPPKENEIPKRNGKPAREMIREDERRNSVKNEEGKQTNTTPEREDKQIQITERAQEWSRRPIDKTTNQSPEIHESGVKDDVELITAETTHKEERNIKREERQSEREQTRKNEQKEMEKMEMEMEKMDKEIGKEQKPSTTINSGDNVEVGEITTISE
jgi:hypothetical protein